MVTVVRCFAEYLLLAALGRNYALRWYCLTTFFHYWRYDTRLTLDAIMLVSSSDTYPTTRDCHSSNQIPLTEHVCGEHLDIMATTGPGN